MTDLEARARAEQEAQAPEPPPRTSLFDADSRALLAAAALQYRCAAITIEALAVSAQPELRDAHIRGVRRFASQAAEMYAGVLALAGLTP